MKFLAAFIDYLKTLYVDLYKIWSLDYKMFELFKFPEGL